MKTVCDLNKCNGCMACFDRCPKHCILIKDDISNFNAIIDEKLCINCKLCEKTCPNVALVEKKTPIIWKQGWANSNIRYKSSSGGAASSIIKSFIEAGGYVASCRFKDGDFLFDITNDLEIARLFAGSKYVKSNPKGIYKKVGERLKTNKVLFIGLPCQVAALKNYISNHENLYTIDLICHGTPSIKLLKTFLNEKRYSINDILDIKFRNKISMGLYVDGKKIEPLRVWDDYICTFLSSINYTENCYSCQFASLDRVSDITIGDSWGSELRSEEKNGISLILCQTAKGQSLLNNIDMDLRNVDLDNAIANNHQLSHPSIMTPTRNKFIKMINNGKSYKYATFMCLPKKVLKQKTKYVLLKFHIMKAKVEH